MIFHVKREEKTIAQIRFKAALQKISDWTIVQLPMSVSSELPSRGQVCIEGKINEYPLKTVLEPDGKGSHWFKMDSSMHEALKIKTGDTAVLIIEPTRNWPEPDLPEDIKNAIVASPQVHKLWMDITPLARWDWIRWIRSTKNPETRRKRIKTACEKMTKGERRPCCFNRNLCTEPEVSHNGVLLEPS